MDNEKRELRQEKREIKRAGTRRVRRLLKRSLDDHPEDAPHDQPDFGRYASSRLNGLDHDSTRRRPLTDEPDDDAACDLS